VSAHETEFAFRDELDLLGTGWTAWNAAATVGHERLGDGFASSDAETWSSPEPSIP
jgi:hypothetical protein